jgi:hypothetical protein
MLCKLLWQPWGHRSPSVRARSSLALRAALKLPLVLIPLPALVVGLLLANGSL